METPFTKYTSLDTETLDAFETQDEFDSNGPFNAEQHDHEFYGTNELETEMVDQFSPDESEQTDEHTFSPEMESGENPSTLSEFEIAQEIQYQAEVAKGTAVKKIEGRNNWAKTVLNKVLGLSLPDDNILDTDTKKALGDFQTKNGLTVTPQIDPATERRLLECDALFRTKGTDLASATKDIIEAAKTKIEDWTKKAVVLKEKAKYFPNDYRDPRKIFALVLHHLAFKRWSRKAKKYSDPEVYLTTGAHFCIMFDGRIIQLHSCSRMIWHSNCTSGGSVGVEFEGNFPDIKGNWWPHKLKPGQIRDEDRPTQAQYDSGRFLASYLKAVLNITRILAHRQSYINRANDPGPDVWYNVGQWAIDKLGLSEGGPTSKCDDGQTIPKEWSTWGNKKTDSTTKKEVTEEYDDHECLECKERRENRETEYSWENESESEQEEGQSYEDESDFNAYGETEELVRDWSDAIKGNRYYGEKLGWHQYTDKINDMLLPYSGMSNVSLGEEAFAEAVFQWQTKNGFTGNNIDGVIGPATWSAMRKKLGIPGQSSGKTPPIDTNDTKYVDGVRFKRVNNGWAAYGGGPLREKLFDLSKKGKLSITPNEIEMFRLVSIPESIGLVNAINSWDDMYMSMGFIQLTIRYYELAQVIKAAPEAFRKHGIELDPDKKYFPKEKNSFAIKNAPNIGDLRSFDWAKRFYKAGLEDDVIVAQVEVGRRILQTIRTRFDKKNYLDRFNNQYPKLWAFIYECHNSRPAPFIQALSKAIAKASGTSITNPVEFAKILIDYLKQSTKEYYSNLKYDNEQAKQKRIAAELVKVEHVIERTEIIK